MARRSVAPSTTGSPESGGPSSDQAPTATHAAVAGRIIAIFGGLAVLAGALATALLAVLFWYLTCDENCRPRGGWEGRADAWQWDAQAVLALLGLVPAVVLVAATLLGRRVMARVAFATTAVLYGVWAIGFFGLFGFFVPSAVVATALLWPLIRPARGTE